MILAGIDEAGYGPLLGPLVVGCCAIRLDAPAEMPLPCLWKRLRKVAGKTRSKSGRRLHINDSKMVYSPAAGLGELERSVLAFLSAMNRPTDTLDQVIAALAGHAVADLAEHGWYDSFEGEPFPLVLPRSAVQIAGNGLRAELTRTGTEVVHLAARVIPERQYNRMVAVTRNKSSLLFSTAAIHLDHLIRLYGTTGLVIFCDRQGGRSSYGPLLRLMFDDWELTIERETDGHCEYTLHRGGGVVRILFCEKAEAQCMPVALASMVCKYLRESLMGRFNSFWQAHLPDLVPTAGYYNDGLRFLNDIGPKRAELRIDDDLLIRSR